MKKYPSGNYGLTIVLGVPRQSRIDEQAEQLNRIETKLASLETGYNELRPRP